MREKVEKLLAQALEENPSLFLIDMSISTANQIRIIIDGDTGVSVEDCMAVSRAIEHNLDREEEDFSLEVSSAGISQPLTLPRQYKKNIGRKLAIKTKEGEKLEGTLVRATDSNCELHWKAREPKPVGKGKITVEKQVVVPFSDIEEATVKITFNK
jgi:ribosome maturation factor RimP